MTSIDARIARRTLGDERATKEMIEDWLGLAGYLAEAVAEGYIAIEVAAIELAVGATGLAERRALHRAADVAATRLGADSLITTLLQRTDSHGAATAEVA